MVMEDKATRILNATLELVAAHGFHGTAMSKIAQQAGLSAGIIYHYFDNKSDLLHALYRHCKLQLSAALIDDDVLKQPHPDYILQLWRNAFHFYCHNPLMARYLDQFENSPYFADCDYGEIEQSFRHVAARIRADVQAGFIKPLPDTVIFDLTFGVAISVAKRVNAGTMAISATLIDEIAMSCYAAIASAK